MCVSAIHVLPACHNHAVWARYTTDAADSQDVAHAAQKATAGMFAAASALGLSMQPLQHQQGTLQQSPIHLDNEAQAALRRLQERVRCAGTDLFALLMKGDVAEGKQ